LVEIGSVVSEEKIFFYFIPLFLFLATSSCLEPVAQLEPNFGKIVIGWSSSKIVSGDAAL
jgi:hypothetical protein